MFVGVMTSKEFLRTRAKAVYNTWGKNITGRIAFFSSEGSISTGEWIKQLGEHKQDCQVPINQFSFERKLLQNN